MITGTVYNYDRVMSLNYGKPWLLSGDKGRSANTIPHRELAELGFLAKFAREVSSSLNQGEVLDAAAKLLYDYFHYTIAVFSFTEGFGGMSAYSPLDSTGCRNSWFKAVIRFPELKYRDINTYRSLGLAAPLAEFNDDNNEVTIELAENCGLIRLFCDGESAAKAGRAVLTGIGESLAAALRNAREHNRVKELSLRDSLTGLYNRRVLEEILHLEKSKRKQSPTSILIIDVDDFKTINDTFGHPAGDQVLSVIGEILINNTRKENIVARYGGEEFAVLLTNTGLETAMQIAERLRMKLADQEFNFSDCRFKLSVSIGVASNDGNSTAPESLMANADQALYQAKRSGKNRVCFHEAHPARIPEKRRRPHIRLGSGCIEGVTTA